MFARLQTEQRIAYRTPHLLFVDVTIQRKTQRIAVTSKTLVWKTRLEHVNGGVFDGVVLAGTPQNVG